MHKLYELRDTLCKELEEYSAKNNFDITSLDIVDKLAHALKNLNKIIEDKERMMNGGYQDSYLQSRSYNAQYGMSYNDPMGYSARGRGPYANRDSMGRYASGNPEDFKMELQGLMQNAPNEQIRQRINAMMSEI